MTLLPSVCIYQEHKLSAVFLFCHEITFFIYFYGEGSLENIFLNSCFLVESAGDTSPGRAGVKVGLAESR